MKYLLDTTKIQNYECIESNDIINIKTKQKIAEITKIIDLGNGILDIRYKITNNNYEYGKGKNIDIQYLDGILQGEIYNRTKRRTKKTTTKDDTFTFRVPTDVCEEYKLTCKVMGSNSARMLNKFMKDYIKENKKYVKEYKKKNLKIGDIENES